MKIFNKIKKYYQNPEYRFLINAHKGAYKNLSDEEYILRKFRAEFGYSPDLSHPQTFNEKLQWLKLYAQKPEYTAMVDKYLVKEYVAGILGSEYIIPTLQVWDSPESMNLSGLPDRFVLKCTHDSHGLVICKDKAKLNLPAVIDKMNFAYERDYYQRGREWVYKNVQHRIIAEEYMEDARTGELRDYKFFCFGGTVKCFKVDYGRFKSHHANYYDPSGQLLPFHEVSCPPDPDAVVELPQTIPEMIRLAEMLSAEIPFVRVDFYDVDGRIYFGEMTFYPASGFGRFEPEAWDRTLGDWLTLPEERIQEETENHR